MLGTLRTPTALDNTRWSVVNYMQAGQLGWLNIIMNDTTLDWVCFDSNRHDCEDYLDVLLDAVNKMIEGES